MEIPPDDDLSEQIEILSSDDEKLKFLGELLSNESSRKILLLLTNQEMSANKISERTNLRLSLVIHHLNKMQQVGIVKISKIVKNAKNHEMKYYSAKLGILILSKGASEKAKTSKSLTISLKRIMRFAAIGIAGLVSWLITKPAEIVKDEWVSGEEIPVILSDDLYISVIIGLGVILIGLVIERVLTSLKK